MQINSSKWIAYAVGYVFITSGIMKLLVPNFKVIFMSLGLPFPSTTLFLIAIIEIACGSLIVAQIYVKQATISLIVIMIGALYVTKIPVLINQGLLAFAFEARLDVIMLILLVILWQKHKFG